MATGNGARGQQLVPAAAVAKMAVAVPTEAAAGLSAKLLRGELMAPDCPSRAVLQHVTSRWGVLVLITLAQGVHRFSELRRKVGGVSEKMLAQTLQGLEGDGFVARTAYPEMPPRVEYRLTPMGDEVAAQVGALADWIEVNLGRVMAARNGR